MGDRPTDALAAHYAVAEAPARQAADEVLFLDVEIANTGGESWAYRGRGAMSLSYRWRDRERRLFLGEGMHLPLPQAVAPGERLVLELPVDAPARSGDYLLEIELVQEGVAWLSELGVAPLTLPITVAAGSSAGRVVCLINSSCRMHDAIGQHIVEQIRFFHDRGDRVLALVEDIDDRWPREVRRFLAPCSFELLRTGQTTLATRRAYEYFTSADFVIVHYSAYYPLAEAIRLVQSGQVIFDYHGVTPAALWSGVQGGEELAAGERNLTLARYADYAIAHSTYASGELMRGSGLSPERVLQMPYVVPLDDYRPGPPPAELAARYGLDGGPTLLYVGRMAANKRVIDLVRALTLIREHLPQARLLLVGDNKTPPYPQLVAEAEALAATLGVADAVIFTGQVDDLPAHYRLCDLFVTASIHEGFCVPVIEAEACGKPVVGADATALPETIGPGGVTFPPGDVEALAERVVALMTQPEFNEKLLPQSTQSAQR